MQLQTGLSVSNMLEKRRQTYAIDCFSSKRPISSSTPVMSISPERSEAMSTFSNSFKVYTIELLKVMGLKIPFCMLVIVAVLPSK